MVDFKATVVDGSFCQADSNEVTLTMAGSLALKNAMTRTNRLRRRSDGKPQHAQQAKIIAASHAVRGHEAAEQGRR
jgi:hypothetical protein